MANDQDRAINASGNQNGISVKGTTPHFKELRKMRGIGIISRISGDSEVRMANDQDRAINASGSQNGISVKGTTFVACAIEQLTDFVVVPNRI